MHTRQTEPITLLPAATGLHVLSRSWWLMLLRGVASILFGIAAFIWPGLTVLALTLLYGAFAMADGILSLGAALTGGGDKSVPTWWLVLVRPEVDLCLKDPGFPVDVVVTADLKTLTRVWMGDVPMAAALRAGSIRLEGPPFLARAFPTWLRLSSFARVDRVATTAAAR